MKTKLIAFVAATLVAFASVSNAKASDFNQAAGTIIGAAAGGVLGSTIGKGDGRIVAIAAGTIIGATMGHTMTQDDGYDVYRERRVVYEPVYKKPEPRRKVVVVKHVHENKYKNKQWKKAKRWNKGRKIVVAENRWGGQKVCKPNGRKCRWVY